MPYHLMLRPRVVSCTRPPRSLLTSNYASHVSIRRKGPTAAVPHSSETVRESSHVLTIPIKGVKSLPTTAAEVGDCFPKPAIAVGKTNTPFDTSFHFLSWAKKGLEIEKSVFGQVARRLSCRCAIRR